MNSHLEQLKLIIRDAWRTLAMLPDPDARFRRAFGGWPLPVVQDPNTAYGSTPASWHGTPTAREITIMEAVFDWLAWLRRQEASRSRRSEFDIVGEPAIKRIAAWGFGKSIWKIAQREGCSERTINRRIDRSVRKIAIEFEMDISKIISRFEAGEELTPINEPELRPERIRGFTPPHVPGSVKESLEIPEAGKVFIDGVGMMVKGEKYRSSLDVDAKAYGKRRR